MANALVGSAVAGGAIGQHSHQIWIHNEYVGSANGDRTIQSEENLL